MKNVFLVFLIGLFLFISTNGHCKDKYISVTHDQVKHIIDKVVDTHSVIPEIKDHRDKYKQLLLETVMTESELNPDKLSSKGNYGYFQIRCSSTKYLTDKIKKDYDKLYSLNKALYDNHKSLKDNLKYNIPYAASVCLLYYFINIKKPKDNLKSKEVRAKTWKKYYNTYKGKGTVSLYLKRTK